MSNRSIIELVDSLPTNNLTVKVLKALDYVAPGEWDNVVGFDKTIRVVTGEDDPGLIQDIKDRAIELYNDQSQGYQTAIWLYDKINGAGSALGTAAMARKVGEDISFLGFLKHVTPKADQAQALDLSLKVVVEIVGFCQVNGIPGDSIGDFLRALGDYGGEAQMRMAALVCLDGLVPLGPDFLRKVGEILGGLTPKNLEKNDSFKAIQDKIPGGNPTDKLGFVRQSFDSVSGWMGDVVESRGLTPQGVVKNLQGWIDIADDKLDYVGAFLDVATDYYYHTGVQTVARRLIERASAEV